jgi:hypothetical protein
MRILIALDRSEYAEIVLEHGLDQAARQPAAELHVVTVVEEGDAAEVRAALDVLVRDALDAFGMTGRRCVLHVVRGRPAPAIGALASQLAADLVVIGRFDVPSAADTLIEVVDSPILVVGVDGVVLDPQCPACRTVRSGGERLFCDAHEGDRMPNLLGRLPPADTIGSRIW